MNIVCNSKGKKKVPAYVYAGKGIVLTNSSGYSKCQKKNLDLKIKNN